MPDYVVNHLRDTEGTFRNCCLVSKSWISHPKMPFLPIVFGSPPQEAPALMEGDASRSLNLHCTSRQHSARRSLSGCHSCRCGNGWLDQRSCTWRWTPVDWSSTRANRRPLSFHSTDSRLPLIPPGSYSHPSVLADFQSCRFTPPSRGLGRDSFLRDMDRQRR